jgi:hypothetical protein
MWFVIHLFVVPILILSLQKKKLNLDMIHIFLGSHSKRSWGCLKNISSDGIICQNQNEASPCCGVCEMGFGFDLPKCHKPQDIKMIVFRWFPFTIGPNCSI